MVRIIGTVTYQDLEGGFWGIVDQNGRRWKPVSMPDQLKHQGAQVTISAVAVDGFDTTMWGDLIHITAFHTIPDTSQRSEG